LAFFVARSPLAIISRGSGELCRCERERGGREREKNDAMEEEDGKTERDGESGRHEGEI